jgi:Holliday junction resolvasome RuvABC endonuclease subunit
MMKNVLALDMATRSGFAALKDGHLFSGAWENPICYSHSPGPFFSAWRTYLAQAHRWYEPEIVAWEFTPPARGISATMIHVGMLTRVQEWAWRNEMTTMSIYPTTLKKFTIGSGRAEKSEMVAAMRKRWKLPRLKDEDEADALAVLAWAVTQKEKMRIRFTPKATSET